MPRDEVIHGSIAPNTLYRPQLYVQHDSDGNSVVGLWAASKNDKPLCVVNKAVKHTVADYSILPEDRYVGVDTSGGAVAVTLPDPADINDGHEVIIDDEGDLAGTGNITIDTPGAETVEGGATLIISTNSAVTKLIYDAANTNWVSV